MKHILSLLSVVIGIGLSGIRAYGEDHGHDHAEENKTTDSHDHGEDDDHEEAEEGGHDHGDEHGDEKNDRFGPGKAILAASKKQGIQLSDVAITTLGVTTAKIDKLTPAGFLQVPLSAAVFYQDEVGVYRFKDGWFKLIEVDVVSKTKNHVIVKNKPKHLGLSSGDRFATSGVPLLRAAELEAWGGSGDGHGH